MEGEYCYSPNPHPYRPALDSLPAAMEGEYCYSPNGSHQNCVLTWEFTPGLRAVLEIAAWVTGYSVVKELETCCDARSSSAHGVVGCHSTARLCQMMTGPAKKRAKARKSVACLVVSMTIGTRVG